MLTQHSILRARGSSVVSPAPGGPPLLEAAELIVLSYNDDDAQVQNAKGADVVTALIVVIVIVVVVALGLWSTYNGLVRRRNQVDNAWSQIDVQLKRRHDLIPNLVESVKGYMQFEQDTLTKVTNARAAAVAAGAQGPAAAGSGREHPDPDAALPVRRRRELPRPQGQPERHLAPGGADDHREQDLLRAPVLQRQRHGLQHQDPAVPGQRHRRHVQLHRPPVLRGRGGRPRGAQGRSRPAAPRCRCSSRRVQAQQPPVPPAAASPPQQPAQ